MIEGLLWFCDDPSKSLTDKITQAARRHRKKYGVQPDVCYVHPSALSGNSDSKVKKVGEVRVVARASVLVHHFWIGVEERRKRRVKAVQGRLL